MKLRDYQESAVEAVLSDWKEHPAVLGTMATGGGKTHVFLAILNRTLRDGQRSLILAHRLELIEQPIERMRQFFPRLARMAGVVMADRDDCAAQVIVATVQTVCKPERMARILRHGPIDYLITDECAHSAADIYLRTYEMLLAANPEMRHLGVTATPVRHDGKGLVDVFGKESFHEDIRKMVKARWLVPPRWLAIQTGISLAHVATGANGDFVGKQLADVYETDNCFELVVESHKKYSDDRQCLAFVQSVEGAYRLAEKFCEGGIDAEAADGATGKKERARVLRDFRAGKTQVLCNVSLWVEGLDVPNVSCIHGCRPTRSDGLYIQMMGRALRILPGKTDALILDYAPAESRNIIMLGDVLGVPARKDAYVQEGEPGEVIAGFTFDGKFNWLIGDAHELISRELDYLDLSPWVWHRHRDWLVLGLGEGSDGVQRSLAIGPPDDDGMHRLWKLGKRRRGIWQAWPGELDLFEKVSEFAEAIAERRADPLLASKRKAWRRKDASAGQERYARGLGVWKDGLNRGECAQRITSAVALRAIERMGGMV